MVGALIIEGKVDAIPAIAAADERLFVFEQFGKLAEKGRIEEIGQANKGAYTAINGRLKPRFVMKAGEVERWRLIHGVCFQPAACSLQPSSRSGIGEAVDTEGK